MIKRSRLQRLISHIGVVWLLLVSMAMAQNGLFISELCDPRNNYLTDRFIEIYNPTDQPLDLSGWQVVAVGNTADIFTWPLSGAIQPSTALVAGDVTTIDVFQVDFPQEAWSDNDGTWNGKVGDGAKLLDPGGNIVDFIVAPGTAFENDDMTRNPDILSPSDNYVADQWTSTPVDLASEGSPGTHTVNGSSGNPQIDMIMLDPANPLAEDTVHVRAEVTDDEGSVTSVILNWGTVADQLENELVMQADTGITYITQSPIPILEMGTWVYFTITASDDIPQTNTSLMQSYWLPPVLEVPDIQGMADTSPYVGVEVVTSGTVLASYLGLFAIMDSTGPWHGLWVQSDQVVTEGDSLVLRGVPTESGVVGFDGTTMLTQTSIIEEVIDGISIIPDTITTEVAGSEAFEGMLVTIEDGTCTEVGLDNGTRWELTDELGTVFVGSLNTTFEPTLGSIYRVTGVTVDQGGNAILEPRRNEDIVWTNDLSSPQLTNVIPTDANHIVVIFSEAVNEGSATDVANYMNDGVAVSESVWEEAFPERVTLTVADLSEGAHELVVNGVEDEHGNATANLTFEYTFVESDEPDGYYDSAAGLVGQALRQVLHDIIDDHNSISYDAAWGAYYTTDLKPNGMIWDIYSDTPGQTPPYEYTPGEDQGGSGDGEGYGYTREHTWPKSWFGGTVSPMYTDLFALYPCDARVNGMRGNDPYGEVNNPTSTSMNGSMKGLNSYPGFDDTVFEPIDAYKGDLARTYFYMSTRYYTEDAGWPGSGAVEGATLLPWAQAMMLDWSAADPVSQKEITRNNAIFAIQGNRNPFIDHPELIEAFFNVTGVDEEIEQPGVYRLFGAFPNPFNPSTTIRYALAGQSTVNLTVFDIGGKEIMTLQDEDKPPGSYQILWHGMDQQGNHVSTGVYFCRLSAGSYSQTIKMVYLK